MNKSLLVLLPSLIALSAQASPVFWPQTEGYYAGKELANNSRSAHTPVAMPYPAAAYYPAAPAMNPYMAPAPAMVAPNQWPPAHALPYYGQPPVYAMPYGQQPYASPYMQPPVQGYPNAPWAGMPSFPNMNNMSMPSMPNFDMPSVSMPNMNDMPMMGSWPGMGNAWNPFPWGNAWNMMPFQ